VQPFVPVILTAVLTAIVAWVVMRATAGRRDAERQSAARAEVSAAHARLEAATIAQQLLAARVATQDEELRQAREHASAGAATAARLESELIASKDKTALLETAEQRLREAFRALSQEALQQNSESLVRLARASLGEYQTHALADLEKRQQHITELVKPLVDTLRQVDGKLAEVEKDRLTTTARLDEQIRALGTGLISLTGETGNLAKALRQPHVRGHWGELQLRRVVELAGLLEHCDFAEQQTIETADGRLRPDLLVHLPGGKTIIVDAKAPLSAYLEALDGDDAHRNARLADHARLVREHMNRLAAKDYAAQVPGSPEFVVMFLPGESIFSAAVQTDPALIESGVEQRVIPASPTTLIAMLKAVSYGWRQARIERNAEQISALGRDLYTRILAMASHIDDVRRHMEKAVESFNKSVGSLESRVLPAARRFKELGAAPDEDIPPVSPIQTVPRELQAPEMKTLLDVIEATPIAPAALSAGRSVPPDEW
jgi:DNA recombination protein RmuC